MVGQTCRFAATTRRSSPTISEISFGNHSRPAVVGQFEDPLPGPALAFPGEKD